MSDVTAVDDLKRRLQVEGGPLIDPGPPGFATVTFVWRAPEGSPVRHVYLEANGVTDFSGYAAVPGTPDSALFPDIFLD